MLVCLAQTAKAQDFVVLPFQASTVAVVTTLERSVAVAELSSSFVLEGYALDFSSVSETGFSTQPRAVNIADDLEYSTVVKHTVTLQDARPLATVHIKTTWNYDELIKPVDADMQALAEYKRTYITVYSNRIGLYIEALVSAFDYTLLAHPLAE